MDRGDTKVYHVDGSGQVRTVLENLAAPGGLQLDGTTLYVLTRQDGKLWRLDTTTGEFTWLADFPGNGLLRLADGDFLTTASRSTRRIAGPWSPPCRV